MERRRFGEAAAGCAQRIKAASHPKIAAAEPNPSFIMIRVPA
jgi:hypothetical protein